ncbi:uncharacterized protein PITG_11938 [Phytophthora infestans T30-4]|uniref:Chitin-binding type-4 domain-containing protein n=1 Tax=Phytophthora infestans (strain T30-4) TaxID=403677 RepID=D0NHK4_PHYIT|nr:uncharacterized protein PITG_11938 [Phytophthora infestans T30-4]EEY58929.1 conserved hypothetical protein [Phytophthora infestans T30-4]|eukprot:XP_002901402.1 conserved hypothetical protein [Phytophthora infestans T30-4]
MTKPTPRPISQQYRADSGVLGEAGEQELQYAPVELLSSRAQSDRPAAATFNILNGCRGSVFEANNTVTDLAAGTPFDVEWVIQAPHPGTMVLSIVKPSADSTGTVTYVPVANLLTIDPFAENSSGKTSTTATIPTSVTWCRSPGDCALQFYWHSDLASQTYPTCADILVRGSGGPSGQTTSATTSPPSTTPSTPSTPSTVTPSAPPASPEESPVPSSTGEKCIRRQRRLVKTLD